MKKYIGGHKVDQSGTTNMADLIKAWAVPRFNFEELYPSFVVPNTTLKLETDDLSLRARDIVSIDRNGKAVRTQAGEIPIGMVRDINITPDGAVVTINQHTPGIMARTIGEDLEQRGRLIHSVLETQR